MIKDPRPRPHAPTIARTRYIPKPDDELTPVQLARRLAFRAKAHYGKTRTFPVLPEATAAYLAGLFDGEGSASIQYTKGHWQMAITITSSAENAFLHRLYNECEQPGSLSTRSRTRGARRPQTIWSMTSRALEWFIRSVYQHLRLKKDTADVLLAFRISMCRSDARKPVLAEEHAHRIVLMQRLRIALADSGSHKYRVIENAN
jgi:hypothetical protein